MQKHEYILGIDTSNYTTSVAIVDRFGTILCDERKMLRVKQGERGLRQSHALFQHMENLPDLISAVISGRRDQIAAVAVAVRPRPVQESYMPVFKAGERFATVLAVACDVPLYTFSHQEGHIEAAKYGSSFQEDDPFLCYHLSGGTCELLKVSGGTIETIGGSKDLSFGQVLDRVGVSLNLSFPCGETLDRMAEQTLKESKQLSAIPTDGLLINLSGLETQILRRLVDCTGNDERDEVIRELFEKISDVLALLTKRAVSQTGVQNILFAGGVSASRFIRSKLTSHFADTAIALAFGEPDLSTDNAVGIALLGGKKQWQ